MAEVAKPATPAVEPPKGWVERLRERVNASWWMQEGRLPSIGRELAYAVEDIRHKLVEEGMFGRQVTPSTFPQEDPAPAQGTGKGAGIHGEQGAQKGGTGPDIHGNGGPSSGTSPQGLDEKQARREKFHAMCREVAARHPAPDPSIDRSPGVAPPAR